MEVDLHHRRHRHRGGGHGITALFGGIPREGQMVDRAPEAYCQRTTGDGQEVASTRGTDTEGEHEDVGRPQAHGVQPAILRVRFLRVLVGIFQAHYLARRNGLFVRALTDTFFTTVRLRHHHVPDDGVGERQVPHSLAYSLRSVHNRDRWPSHHLVQQAARCSLLWPLSRGLWHASKYPGHARLRTEPDGRREEKGCCRCSDD